MSLNTLLTTFGIKRSDILQNIAFICVCVVLFLFGSPAGAGPGDDLGVVFHGDRSMSPPGGIAGTVTNRSAQHYRCVDLVFRLIYKAGTSGPEEKRVRVENLFPRSVKNYSASLESRAGFRLQRIETCPSASGDTLPTPDTDGDYCTIKGSVTSTLGFQGVGDGGRFEKIERVFLLTPDGRLVSEEPLSKRVDHVRDHRNGKSHDSREFDFARIPANQNYVVRLSNAWKTVPTKIRVRCPDSRGRYEFEIAPLKHVGNRLGG